MTFFTSSFKRSKSMSKYYNSLELEFLFLQHWVPPSALAVSELHFLTAHDIEEVSLPKDSSRQVPGYADTAHSCLAPGQNPPLVQRRHRQKFRQWLMLVWGPQGCVNMQIAFKKSACQISLVYWYQQDCRDLQTLQTWTRKKKGADREIL